jgi:outer membrane protein OmpA-like peptidoglycan-associated protein
MALAVAIFFVGSANADDAEYRRFEEGATKSQMMEFLLTPSAGQAGDGGLLKQLPSTIDSGGVTTRGGVLKPERAPANDSVVPAAVPPPASNACPAGGKTFGTAVNFALGSYYLEPSTFSLLSEVASVMGDPLLEKCGFIVEGHTDSTGSADSNMVLSNQRAKTVGKYLESHGVEPDRMILQGKGSSEPADPSNPAGDVNRRVQFRFVDRNAL